MKVSHNPYFNRWFSVIMECHMKEELINGHNPYFNRWFSAIYNKREYKKQDVTVTILILVDGFLQ